MAKLMGSIAKGLGVIDGAPSGGSIKVSIKARLLDSFIGKETAMATPSQGVYGDAMLRNQQVADPFCSNSIIGAHMGVVDVLET
jgi:hypothetical protein